jgi:heat shock protein HslJ
MEGSQTPDAKAGQSSEDRLDQTAWVLKELPSRELVENTQITLSFANGKVSGSDGCNRFHSSYAVKGEELTIDPRVASTRSACPEPIMEQASAFITALGSTRSTRLDAEQLSLLDESGALLATFTAQPAEVAGARWDVLGYNNGRGGVTSLIRGTSLTIEFAEDGSLSGSAGCNRFKATYSVNGTRMQIGPAAATRRLCEEPQGVMEQEAAFLKALEGTHVTRFEGDRMELRSESGALMISARRAARVEP